jgi:hypothetical protein
MLQVASGDIRQLTDLPTGSPSPARAGSAAPLAGTGRTSSRACRRSGIRGGSSTAGARRDGDGPRVPAARAASAGCRRRRCGLVEGLGAVACPGVRGDVRAARERVRTGRPIRPGCAPRTDPGRGAGAGDHGQAAVLKTYGQPDAQVSSAFPGPCRAGSTRTGRRPPSPPQAAGWPAGQASGPLPPVPSRPARTQKQAEPACLYRTYIRS